ncbi:nucleoside triphosphate pyrophosphatase [Paenibacillus sp. OV219]|uniref:Maf family protein n=1 Tax=Paenibacillus sp. OV219 TaxID=1884377 RepID=UPI0008C45DCF|nr:Maf family protein [Paenibacillus sp. OV219]SEM67289.1 septum formation protein [Paenibacillus sp. OV219]
MNVRSSSNSSSTIRQLVLASSSPRRQELVASLGLSLPVLILSSDADESTPQNWSPAMIVEQLGLRKARASAELLSSEANKSSLIIGADTIVVLDGKVLGKPSDKNDAIRMLTALEGRQHEVYTGVALIEPATSCELVYHRMTRVTMKQLGEERIRRYVDSGEPLDKAGSYGIQGLGATMVERIDGCYFNVVGLPLSLLSDMLDEFGINVI